MGEPQASEENLVIRIMIVEDIDLVRGALAAVLSGAHAARGRVVAVIVSGGNVDATVFAEALAETTRPS